MTSVYHKAYDSIIWGDYRQWIWYAEPNPSSAADFRYSYAHTFSAHRLSIRPSL